MTQEMLQLSCKGMQLPDVCYKGQSDASICHSGAAAVATQRFVTDSNGDIRNSNGQTRIATDSNVNMRKLGKHLTSNVNKKC